MIAKNLEELVDHIDHLVSVYIEERSAAATGKILSGRDIDVESILEYGIFPPDDPATPTRMALLSIGVTLGFVGGRDLMHEVHEAYKAKYGAGKAGTLSVRWDTAANIWYN